MIKTEQKGNNEMLNFTVGPVTLEESVLKMGQEQIPYFRTKEFSKIMLENEQLMLQFSYAPEGSRTIFLTGSGTAAMEAAIMNVFNDSDKVLVINGGSFGQRFVNLCKIHRVPYTEIKLEQGKNITLEKLSMYEQAGYTGLIVNLHETSTGVLYDLPLLAHFCRRNKLFFLVDAISAFLADSISMEAMGISLMLTGSQKALACPPGISILVLSPEAIDRIEEREVTSLYFNLKDALKDGERGQTPFTPAVGILRQIHMRLKEIAVTGGVEAESKRIATIAADFRKKIKGMPFDIVSESLSNAVTPLHPWKVSAYDLFTLLKDDYHIWVCPNGGELAKKVFRVGHIGALTLEDNTTLVHAMELAVKQLEYLD